MLDSFLNRVASYGGLTTSLSSNKSIAQNNNSPKQQQQQQQRATEIFSDPESPDSTDSSLLMTTSPNFIPKRSRPKLLDRHKKNGLRFQSGFGLRQARSLGRLDTLKENENLGSFIRFRTESQSELIDGRIKDLDRIQDLFPNDFLGLHYPDINQFNNNTSPINAMNTWNKKYLQKRTYFRRFLDEAPCTVSNIHGIHTPRQRHLFLFSDILLLAKPRLGGNFKLKLRLRVSELWISPCSQESEIGFLLGWPVAGSAKTVLLRFCTQAARDTWWKSLTNAIASQLLYEPKTTNIRVSCNDPTTGIYCRRTVNIGSLMSINQIIQLTFNDIPAIGSKNYSLWVCENGFAPCELLGCERPHSIQMSRLRQSLSTDEGFDLEHCNNTLTPCSIVFELRINKSSSSSLSSSSSSSSSTPKKCTTKPVNPENVNYPFFGLPLNRLCSNGLLHPILKAILQGLYLNGLETEGIFRKCASAKVLRELKEKINRSGTAICSELLKTPPLLLAALLKEFLRNMPYPLLSGPTISDWLHVNSNRTVHYLHSLLMKLPHDNYNLLSVIVCLLFHIARRSNYNLMSATNLSVCLGPSLLWDPDNCSKQLKSLTTIVEMLIDNCQTLFGSHVVSLLGTNAYNFNNNDHLQQQQQQQQQQQYNHHHNHHQSNSNHHVNEEFEVSQISGISLLGHHHHHLHHLHHHNHHLLQSCNIDRKSESQDSGLMSSESERESPNSNFSANIVYGQRNNTAVGGAGGSGSSSGSDPLSRSINFSNKSSIDEDEAFCSSDDLVKSSLSSSSSSSATAAAAVTATTDKSTHFKNSSVSLLSPLSKLTTTFTTDNNNRRLLIVADNHVVTYV